MRTLQRGPPPLPRLCLLPDSHKGACLHLVARASSGHDSFSICRQRRTRVDLDVGARVLVRTVRHTSGGSQPVAIKVNAAIGLLAIHPRTLCAWDGVVVVDEFVRHLLRTNRGFFSPYVCLYEHTLEKAALTKRVLTGTNLKKMNAA